MLPLSFKVKAFFLLVLFGFVYAIIDAVQTDRWWLLVVIYIIASVNGLIAGNIGCHRYFCHRSFETKRWKAILLAFWSVLAGLDMGPIGFTGVHDHHHKHSDTPKDLHSPQQRPWWYIAAGIPVLKPENKITWSRASRNLFNDPVLKFIEYNYFVLWTALMFLFYFIGGFDFLLYGLIAPAGLWTVQVNLLINCFGHHKIIGSYSNYDNKDYSTNNKLINWVTWGEGLQNNHHRHPGKYNHAVNKDEFDPAAWIIDKFFIIKENKP